MERESRGSSQCVRLGSHARIKPMRGARDKREMLVEAVSNRRERTDHKETATGFAIYAFFAVNQYCGLALASSNARAMLARRRVRNQTAAIHDARPIGQAGPARVRAAARKALAMVSSRGNSSRAVEQVCRHRACESMGERRFPRDRRELEALSFNSHLLWGSHCPLELGPRTVRGLACSKVLGMATRRWDSRRASRPCGLSTPGGRCDLPSPP
jgi:hypothetical protein